MLSPATKEQIEAYKRHFAAEPDRDFLEWLTLCNGMTIAQQGWTLYEINSTKRDFRSVPSAFSHIASDICSGYGVSYETGECRCFDHDFGIELYPFISVLRSCLDALRDCVSEYDDEREEAYLIENGRALSDSFAEFIMKLGSADSVKSYAEKARADQIKTQEQNYHEYYDHIEIVKEYKAYVNEVCGGTLHC